MVSKSTSGGALPLLSDGELNGEALSGQVMQQLSGDEWQDSLAGKLASIQNSLNKLGLRKERYAETIRQAVRDGRVNARTIEQDLSGRLRNLQEKLAERGLGLSGAQALVGEELQRQAAADQREAKQKTADAVTSARSQLQGLDSDTLQQLAAASQAIAQATKKG